MKHISTLVIGADQAGLFRAGQFEMQVGLQIFLPVAQGGHGKGATPGWSGFAADADPDGRTIIPLNMAEPVLIVRGADAASAPGFSPHGAGQNCRRAINRRLPSRRRSSPSVWPGSSTGSTPMGA